MKRNWDILETARNPARPGFQDLLPLLCDKSCEIRGDKVIADDPAVWTGLALIGGMPLTLIGQRRPHNQRERITSNNGQISASGYRKICRAARQAEKFRRPIIIFIDTKGADSSDRAVNLGMETALNETFSTLATVNTPIFSFILGEAMGRGAQVLTISDRLYMFENAAFSSLSPESLTMQLPGRYDSAAQAAKHMKLTWHDLKNEGIMHGMIEEEKPLDYPNLPFYAQRINEIIRSEMVKIRDIRPSFLIQNRLLKLQGEQVIL